MSDDGKDRVDGIDGSASVFINTGGSISVVIDDGPCDGILVMCADQARDLAELLVDCADQYDERRRLAREERAKARADRRRAR